MTLKALPVKLLSLIAIAVPMMAQEGLTFTPTAQAPALAPQLSPQLSKIRADISTRDRERASANALYRWSMVTLLAANAADVASSWRNTEANPVIAAPAAQFGLTSVAIKSGFVGASLVLQHVVLRHRPDAAKRLAWMNFVSSGVLGGVAAHNIRLR